MRDDIATTTGGNLPADSAASGATHLGDEVFQVDTRMAGYRRPGHGRRHAHSPGPRGRGRSAEEISVWVPETRAARSAGMDLDHAVEAVRQRTLSRYAPLSAEAAGAAGLGDAGKYELVGGTAPNVGGIWHWLDRLGEPAS